jgi:molecular chaperone DnaK
MVADAEKFAEEDHKRREAAEVRNQADQVTYQVDKSLEEWGDKLPESDRDELKKLNDELKETLKGDDAEAITKASEAVVQRWQTAGATVQQAAQPEQAPTGAAPGASDAEASDGDGDVVEGEIVDEGGAS